MSRADYDLDSGGLMPLIQALIRPPDSREASRQAATKKQAHPYYRRPGRGHNRDCCDACREGGDLICCDKCPASFHLGCHDPPLNKEDIPAGLWLCHHCRTTQASTSIQKPQSKKSSSISIDAASIESGQSSRRNSEQLSRPTTPNGSELNAAKIRLNKNRATSRSSSRSRASSISDNGAIHDKDKIKVEQAIETTDLDTYQDTNITNKVAEVRVDADENKVESVPSVEIKAEIEINEEENKTQEKVNEEIHTDELSKENKNDDILNDGNEREDVANNEIIIEIKINEESVVDEICIVENQTTKTDDDNENNEFKIETTFSIDEIKKLNEEEDKIEKMEIGNEKTNNQSEPEDKTTVNAVDRAQAEKCGVIVSIEKFADKDDEKGGKSVESDIAPEIPKENCLDEMFEDDSHQSISAFEKLICAASIMNPRQFQLPREYNLHTRFPGDDKITAETSKAAKKTGGRGGANGANRPKHELDAQGLVPLPAKTCFYCRKSCKKAPLLACDYCPSYFHLDCLDPPLTALPTGLWMCPNHPEQFVDWKLVKSISATERVRLWEQFSGVVDQEAIKLEFLRKVHAKNPPFRFKLKPKARVCAEIPAMVEYMYKNPPPLLPSLRDVLRYEKVYKRTTSADITNEIIGSELENQIGYFKRAKQNIESFEKNSMSEIKTEEDNDLEIIEEKTNEIIVKDDDPMDVEEIKLEEGAETDDTQIEATKSKPEQEMNGKENGTMHDAVKNDDTLDNNKIETKKVERDTQQLNEKTEQNTNQSTKRRRMTSTTKGFGVECYELLDLPMDAFKNTANDKPNDITANDRIDEELKLLDMAIIKRLALRQLQQVLHDNPDLVTRLQTERANKEIYNELKMKQKEIKLPSQLLSRNDIKKIARQLALSDSSDLSETSFDENEQKPDIKPLTVNNILYTNGLDHIEGDTEKALVIARRLEKPIAMSKIRARAVLTPVGDILSGKRWYTNTILDGAIYMRTRSLTIGTGLGCDLQFQSVPKCCRLSPRHASIFYDETTKLYELLNYSEYGTEVNGQLYSCDFTEYPEVTEHRAQDINGFYENIRNIIDEKRNVKRIEYREDENTVMAAPELPRCHCTTYSPLLKGWEGSALLSHGTLLRFGCLAFVFSIVSPPLTDEMKRWPK